MLSVIVPVSASIKSPLPVTDVLLATERLPEGIETFCEESIERAVVPPIVNR
jgi:hypothetical protein